MGLDDVASCLKSWIRRNFSMALGYYPGIPIYYGIEPHGIRSSALAHPEAVEDPAKTKRHR